MGVSQLPSPSELLGGGSFDDWYPGQYDAFQRSLEWYDSPARFLGMSLPTGSGKTVVALLLARLSEARVVIITATRGLQSQYAHDSQIIGAVNVIGQQNFPCLLVAGLRADEGPCHDGMPCSLRDKCPYRVQLSAAQKAPYIVTNYAYWMAQCNFSSGIGERGLIICDEAHQAFGALENHLTLSLYRMDIQPHGLYFPPDEQQWGVWKSWAGVSLPVIERVYSELDGQMRSLLTGHQVVPGGLSRSVRQAKSVLNRLQRLASVTEDWVIQRVQHGYRFVPKWVDRYSAQLFCGVPKVVLMSAVLSHRSCDYLGVPREPEHRWWIEMGSHFPPRNTQIWHVPTARINFRTDDYGSTLWAVRVDQIIQRRLDRKGILFTVSYERARLLLERSRFKDIMLTHGTWDVAQVVERFKGMPPPAVLLSPSVTTGFDFPAHSTGIRYLVIGKIPYPDTQDPVTKARHAEDKSWTSYLAMETLVQSAGRATRGVEDCVEVLIIDDNFKWYYYQYRDFAPAWFRERVRGSLQNVPDPLV